MSRPRTPTEIKKTQGNPGKRAINKQEPDPAYLDDLSPPSHLPENAKKIWAELAQPLRRTKLLTEVDRDAFGMICTSLSQYRHASLKLAEIENLSDDNDKKHTLMQFWLIAQSMSFKQAMKGLTEFGMTPRARTAIALQAQTDMFTDLTKTSQNGIGKYVN